jgi:hypothetical protein
MKIQWLIVALWMSACGPSAKDVERARAASYSCEPQQVFDAMVAEMKERRLPIAQIDTDNGMVISDYRWHTATGTPKQKGAAVVGQGDLAVAIVARLVEAGEVWRVAAEPDVLSHVVGSPRGQRLVRTDADWPKWADSKIDVYMVGVRERLSSCEVQSAP